MQKIKVAVIFGGRSAEHEVSLQSAKNVIESLNKDRFDPVLIGIDRTGRWFLNEKSIVIHVIYIPLTCIVLNVSNKLIKNIHVETDIPQIVQSASTARKKLIP